jgi:ATP citrate (pro-S)-lyase
MLNIQELKNIDPKIICIGNHPGIIQSILDFDYMSGKSKSSVVGILSGHSKFERYFWGDKEILIPVFENTENIATETKSEINLFLNLVSARRIFSKTIRAFEDFPNLLGGVIFGENLPEKDSLSLIEYCKNNDKFIIGPSSVGLVIPGHLKLGAISGVFGKQLLDSKIFTKGNAAVFSSSGGMTGELIRLLALKDKGISFALSFGGDRFPITTPKNAFLQAQNDPNTDYIVYFGELGGYDEYELVKLLEEKKLTKKVIAYIGGTISEMFETPPQFGHAKAMAKKGEESARAKREALQKAGAMVGNSFGEFAEMIGEIQSKNLSNPNDLEKLLQKIESRKSSLFISSISGEKDGEVKVLGEDLLSLANNNSFANLALSMLLGKKNNSKDLEEFVDYVFKIAIDHGPNVSGAVNTMITARAGKDLVSSLAAGLLTIGPRFGGAINEAAGNWLEAINKGMNPFGFVESFALENKYISGIGHKKYRIDIPDPRVKQILAFREKLANHPYSDFALEVQKITTSKKGNLILNIDGAIAAVFLDLLAADGMNFTDLKQLVEIEFFNAFFVLPRAFGFTAHYFDQRRLDEGLFRLGTGDVGLVAL